VYYLANCRCVQFASTDVRGLPRIAHFLRDTVDSLVTSGMRTYLALVVGLTLGIRVVWFAQFVYRSLRRPNEGRERHWWDRLKNDSWLPARLRGDERAQDERYDLFKTQQVASYTLGGLALAAWAVLATNSTATEARRFALAMLAVTVLTSISAPVLFRLAGGELTRMGFESALAVAGLALVAAMLALSLDTFHGPWITWAARLLPAVLLVRELIDTAQQISLTRTAVFGVSGSQPPAPPRSGGAE
jgi:hypothetical protein